MNYLLDTNILVIYSKNSALARKIEADYQLFNEENKLAISVVTIGEINSLIAQHNYGERRTGRIDQMIEKTLVVDLNIKKILELYGQIDAYSQGNLDSNPLENSARNMGKNDLWIAATASAFDMVLVTTDKDFEGSSGNFVERENYVIFSFHKTLSSGK